MKRNQGSEETLVFYEFFQLKKKFMTNSSFDPYFPLSPVNLQLAKLCI